MLSWLPERVAGPLSNVRVTGRPEEAVALSMAEGPGKGIVAGGTKAIVCVCLPEKLAKRVRLPVIVTANGLPEETKLPVQPVNDAEEPGVAVIVRTAFAG